VIKSVRFWQGLVNCLKEKPSAIKIAKRSPSQEIFGLPYWFIRDKWFICLPSASQGGRPLYYD